MANLTRRAADWLHDLAELMRRKPRFVFDIETNGFLEATTVIHCLVLKDVDTGHIYDFADAKYGHGSIAEGVALLASASLLIGHNILKFDIPAINKLFPGTLPLSLDDLCRYEDTLVEGRLLWTDLKESDAERRKKNPASLPGKLVGAHKLEAWGYRLGLLKGEYGKNADGTYREDRWDFWNPEMHDYCIQDVEVTDAFWRRICSKAADRRAIKLEHEFAFVIAQMEANGFPFDEAGAAVLYAKLVARRLELANELKAAFPPERLEEVFIPKVNNKTRGYVKGVPFTKVHFIEFNPSSRQQIAKRLKALGWEPEELTPSGEPKLSETIMAGLALRYPQVARLAEYFMVEKRIGQIAEGEQAWLRLVRRGRIHGGVNPNGAVTGRCTHSNPNVAQVPKVGKPYGEECRALFGPRKGWTQVGIDLAGLELRALAHFIAFYDQGEYARIVLEGDPHWRTVTAMELVLAARDENDKLHKLCRDGSKTFIYGFLYGCGDAKAGSIVFDIILSIKAAGLAYEALLKKFFGDIVEPKKDDFAAAGKKLKDTFLKGFPALAKLREAIEDKVCDKVEYRNRQGRSFTRKVLRKDAELTGLDGRKLRVRKLNAVLNVVLQSAGALISKLATVIAYRNLSALGYVHGRDWAFMAHIHDEVQIECKPSIAKLVGEQVVLAMQEAGRQFGLRIPIDGEAKQGANWKECH